MEPDDRYRVVHISEAAELGQDALIAFWDQQEALRQPTARERVSEVAFVALHEREGLAGLSTIYLARSPRLRMDLWHYRTFVAPQHRRSALAERLLTETREHLEARFVSGSDTRGPGMLVEVESQILKRRTEAVWPRVDFVFVGDNARGEPCRVYYFRGAQVPPPG